MQDCLKKNFCRVKDCEKKHSTFLHGTETPTKLNKADESNVEKTQSNGFIDTGEAFKTTSNFSPVIGLPIFPVQVRAKGHHKSANLCVS